MYQDVCGLIDFDVEAFVSGSWSVIGTTLVPTNTVTWASHRDAGSGYVDSFYARPNVFVYALTAAVAATAVRVNVRDVTYGGAVTVAASNGGGFANRYGLLINGGPTGGTFTYVWNGLTTAAVAWNANAAAVQTAFRALAGGSATVVTGGTFPAGQMVVDFKGALSYRSLVVGTNSLTGGTTPVPGIGNEAFVSDDTRAAGQGGPRVLACEIAVYLSGTTDGGTATPGSATVALRK
jgi:hypothetical protein